MKNEINFIFDKDNAYWQNDNMEFNKVAILNHANLLGKLFKTIGYIYLNNIYELLFVEWDPHRINQCFIYGEDGNEIELIILEENINRIVFKLVFN